jgi:hypothetical protein
MVHKNEQGGDMKEPEFWEWAKAPGNFAGIVLIAVTGASLFGGSLRQCNCVEYSRQAEKGKY